MFAVANLVIALRRHVLGLRHSRTLLHTQDLTTPMSRALRSDVTINLSGTRRREHTYTLTKSPNVLIYIGKRFSLDRFSELRDLMTHCVGTNSYTIYHLKHDDITTTPWRDNCQLLVVAVERLFDGVDAAFTEYFYSGGTILSFCSNLDADFINKQENENCNQPQIVKIEYERLSASLTQGRYFYTGCDSLLPNVTLRPLASNHRGQLVIVEAENSEGGLCIFSQVHMEKCIDSSSVQADVVAVLSQTDRQRVEIVSSLLSRLDIHTVSQEQMINTTSTCHIMSTQGQSHRHSFIDKVKQRHPAKVKNEILTIPSTGVYELKSPPDEAGAQFNMQEYNKNLTSQVIGNTLLLQSITKTTQALIEPFLFNTPQDCGLVAIARRQMSGIGRGDNAWLSPEGSLSLSMYIRLQAQWALRESPALIQTIPAVAAARAISQLLPSEYKAAENKHKISVKWPNDLYYGKVKIGGVVVKSTLLQNCLHAIVGIGVNVTNRKPTVNVNEIIDSYNSANKTDIGHVTVEWMAARICSETEVLIDLINADKQAYLNEYYKHWMHSGVRVDVPKDDIKQALILGLDSHGYLLLQKEDGRLLSVGPDGNSFDIMHNLIRVK